MKDYHGNHIPDCVAEYARELGAYESDIFKLNSFYDFFEPNLIKLWNEDGFFYREIEEGKVIAYARNSMINRSIIYSQIPKEKLEILLKIINEREINDNIKHLRNIRNFLDIPDVQPIDDKKPLPKLN